MLPRLLIGCLVIALIVIVPIQAAPVDKHLPNDSDAVVSFNIQQIVASSLFKTHYLGPIQELLKSNDDVQQTLKNAGVDPLKDIDQVIFTNGESLYRLTKRTDKGKVVYGSEGGYFFLIKGRFNVAKLNAQAEMLAKEKRSFTVKPLKAGAMPYYEIEMGRTLFAGIVDGSTIAVSSRSEPVVEVLERAAGKRKSVLKYKELTAAVTKMDARKSIGIAITGSAGFGLDAEIVKVNGKMIEKPIKQMLSQDGIDSIAGSIQVADDITGNVSVGVRGNNTAKEVAKSLQQDLNDSIEASFNLFVNYPKLSPLAEFIKSIKITVKDTKTVMIEGNVTAKQVKDALK